MRIQLEVPEATTMYFPEEETSLPCGNGNLIAYMENGRYVLIHETAKGNRFCICNAVQRISTVNKYAYLYGYYFMKEV